MEKTHFSNSESRSQCENMNLCNELLLLKQRFEITNKQYEPCTLPWVPSFSFREINKVFVFIPFKFKPKVKSSPFFGICLAISRAK